jgi:hypothetical protein
MARRIELKIIDMAEAAGGSVFDYGELLINILRFAPPGGGMNADEVLRCGNAQEPLLAAIKDEADHFVLTDEQWRTLRDKADKFQYTVAIQEVCDFILMIRNAKEIGAEEKAKRPRAQPERGAGADGHSAPKPTHAETGATAM